MKHLRTEHWDTDASGAPRPIGIEEWWETHRVFRGRALFEMPTEGLENAFVPAVVDHGRWIAHCPYCPGAEWVDPEDLRFFCLSCYNAQNGGRWIEVRMPLERKVIEEVMAPRPQPFQNWTPAIEPAELVRLQMALTADKAEEDLRA